MTMNKIELNEFTFYNADNMDIMKQYPDKYFDLAIVDPPYGININVSMGRRKGDKKSDYHKFAGEDKSIPSKEYYLELFRISKNQIIWGGNYMTEYLKPSPCWILWDKGFSEDVTFAQFEMAWTSFSSSAKKYDLNAAANKDRIHPTQKPIALYEWILQKYANENDKILDTHLGSGSIAIAIDKANTLDKKNLTFVGIELDPDYFNASIERFRNHKAQFTLF
jgi:site-specific DNA-methyltransferase (adenine-specific)